MKRIFAVSALLLAACGGAPEPKATQGPKKPAGLENAQAFDINGDGVPDVWKAFDEADGKQVLAKKAFDINFDGKVDVWRIYTPDGALERDRMDMDFDGKVDVTTFYEGDQVVRAADSPSLGFSPLGPLACRKPEQRQH